LSYESWGSKTGRPLKPDATAEAVEDYLQAYTTATQLGFQGRGGGGRGRGGGGGRGQKDSSGNCGQHSMWWWGSDILDTGTPPGARAQAMGNPAPLVNMLSIYPNTNIIFDNGYCYSVAAKDGVAQGQRKPVTCSVFNHQQGGFGFSNGTPNPYSMISNENIERKLEYRRLYQAGVWAMNELKGLGLTGGFQGRGGGGGGGRGGGHHGGGGGGNDGGQRMIQATIGGKSQRIAIDTGTDAILGAGNGSKSCVFPPNPSAISIPSTSHSQASYYYVPAWNISQRIRICLTNEYTICQSLGSGGTISYNWKGGGQQQGDALQGKEWGTGAPALPQAPPQKPGQPSYTQPLTQEPQQNQYFKRGGGRSGGGYGYWF
jgi:hypothetical protein